MTAAVTVSAFSHRLLTSPVWPVNGTTTQSSFTFALSVARREGDKEDISLRGVQMDGLFYVSAVAWIKVNRVRAQ